VSACEQIEALRTAFATMLFAAQREAHIDQKEVLTIYEQTANLCAYVEALEAVQRAAKSFVGERRKHAPDALRETGAVCRLEAALFRVDATGEVAGIALEPPCLPQEVGGQEMSERPAPEWMEQIRSLVKPTHGELSRVPHSAWWSAVSELLWIHDALTEGLSAQAHRYAELTDKAMKLEVENARLRVALDGWDQFVRSVTSATLRPDRPQS
jgi:hypothetical protein